MRRSLQEIGLFDTQFFLYYDDVDISIRTQQSGIQNMVCAPCARMWAQSKPQHRISPLHPYLGHARCVSIVKHSQGLQNHTDPFYAFLHGGFHCPYPPTRQYAYAHPTLWPTRGLLSGLKPFGEPDSASKSQFRLTSAINLGPINLEAQNIFTEKLLTHAAVGGVKSLSSVGLRLRMGCCELPTVSLGTTFSQLP